MSTPAERLSENTRSELVAEWAKPNLCGRARAQRGVVDDRAEGDAVLQVGKEHCAGEVARADDVDARDGLVESLCYGWG